MQSFAKKKKKINSAVTATIFFKGYDIVPTHQKIK